MRSSRRTFAKTLALAPFLSIDSLAQETPKPPSALGNALTEVVRAQSGQFLDAAEMQQASKDFQDYAGLLERFRSFKLVNSDEPDFTFSARTSRW
ncbi:MAG TPA: hypothetical protein VF980_10140 [Thermoanaerobaculia bacterium]